MSCSEGTDVKVVWRRGKKVATGFELLQCGWRTEVFGERRARQIAKRHWFRRHLDYFNSSGSYEDSISRKKSTQSKEVYEKRDVY